MTLKEQITRTQKGMRAWHQERTIFETTNLMCKVMKEGGVSRSELANRMGTSKGYVTQLLDGTTNMTLRTVSDVFVALGREFHPGESPLDQPATFGASIESEAPEFPVFSTLAIDITGTEEKEFAVSVSAG
jgi:hypothetical protein